MTGRAAALGEVPSSVVAATFAVFEPGLIDALWTEGRGLLPLTELIAIRDRATIASLREVLAGADETEVGRVADLLERAVAGVDGTGRVLFSALRPAPARRPVRPAVAHRRSRPRAPRRRSRGRLRRRGVGSRADALVDALGPDLAGITAAPEGWSQRCVDAKSFPPDIRKRAAG